MPEVSRSASLKPGHPVPTILMRRHLWRLMSLFCGNRGVVEACVEEAHGESCRFPLTNLEGEFLTDEITEALLASAIMLRSLDDQGQLAGMPTACGKLWDSYPSEYSQVMTLREACNKIVHAQKVNFDVEVSPTDADLAWLAPRMHLYGRRSGRDWKAQLEIIEYIRAAIIHVEVGTLIVEK